ncbi:hypothetical protein GCM10023067_57800 [Aminobacter aganoensis]
MIGSFPFHRHRPEQLARLGVIEDLGVIDQDPADGRNLTLDLQVGGDEQQIASAEDE